MFLTQTSAADYEALCRLDVLGLQDHPVGDQNLVFEEFKEQLTRNPEGWYETGLLWKGNHPPLPNNKHGSLKRLENLVRKLEKQPGMLQKYDGIIQDQLSQGIVERMHSEPQGTEFYIPHKAVIRETVESTKIRIVYDASARANEKAPSLNDCLETGPPLQNCRGPEVSFSTSENPGGGQRRDAISLAQGPRHQTRGNFMLHTSTVRFVHISILTRGSDRSAPKKSSEHLPKVSRRDPTKPLRG